jgi:hypothetical protein
MTLYLVADPIPHPAVERARLHRRLSALIDRLIVILDDIDGYSDLEDGGDDEPSLAHPETGTHTNQAVVERTLPYWRTHETDLEDECDDEGGEHDGREPEDGW